MRRLTRMMTLLLLPLSYVITKVVNGIKTNLLDGGLSFTPNFGVELSLEKRTTLDIATGYNPWN